MSVGKLQEIRGYCYGGLEIEVESETLSKSILFPGSIIVKGGANREVFGTGNYTGAICQR
jgi:hypothetical protein